MKCSRWMIWIPAALVALLLSSSASSGPTFPKAQQVAAEARSLIGIRTLRVRVELLPTTLENAGVTARAVRENWRRRLEQGGYTVVTEDPDVPELSLEVSALVDRQFPDALALSAMLRLRQPVTVDRLSESMPLTTYVDQLLALDTEEAIVEILEDALNGMVDRFMNKIRRADEAAEAE